MNLERLKRIPAPVTGFLAAVAALAALGTVVGLICVALKLVGAIILLTLYSYWDTVLPPLFFVTWASFTFLFRSTDARAPALILLLLLPWGLLQWRKFDSPPRLAYAENHEALLERMDRPGFDFANPGRIGNASLFSFVACNFRRYADQQRPYPPARERALMRLIERPETDVNERLPFPPTRSPLSCIVTWGSDDLIRRMLARADLVVEEEALQAAAARSEAHRLLVERRKASASR